MKRGRPRKSEDQAGITWSMWQRLRGVSRETKLEEPVGRMAFLGEFTAWQWDAIEKIRKIYLDFDNQLGAKRWAASPSFEVGQGLSPVHEDENERERAEIAKRDYLRLWGVFSRFPPRTINELEELCLQGRTCTPGYLPQIKTAIDAAADAFGYKIRKKRLDKSIRVPD